MGFKKSNEITVKIKCELKEFYKIVEEKKLIAFKIKNFDEKGNILIQKVNNIGIPIYTDNYFVKKAEVELNKILRKGEV